MGQAKDRVIGLIGLIVIVVILIIIGHLLLIISEHPLEAFLIISLTLIIIYFYWRREKQRAKQRKEDEEKKKEYIEEQFQEKRKLFLQSDSYKILQNYVKRYGDADNIQEMEKLRNLMLNKGFEFKEEEIIRLVREEKVEQEYQDFKKRILLNNPKQLDDYLINFVEFEYPNNYEKALLYLKVLLNEQQISFFEETLTDRINQLKKQVELEHFENKLLDGNFSIRMSDIDVMSGYEFESFLKQLFEKMGYTVKQTNLSGDQGADLIISRLGEEAVVQAKRHAGKVSNSAIQEVTAAIKHYKVDKGIVVTTSEFTNSAKELATSNNIELIDREKLKSLIDTYF